MLQRFKKERVRRPQNGNGERPWINRLIPDENTLNILADTKDMFQLSLPNNDDNEKPWITRLVAEKFFYELSKDHYGLAWDMLDYSKQKEITPLTIKEKWEKYTKDRGGLKQRIGSKLIGSNNGGTVVCVTFKAEDNTQAEVDVFVTVIKDDNEHYRIFECTPVEDNA